MKKLQRSHLLIIIFFLLFFFLFSSISLSRLYSLQIFHYDFGIFGHIIWQLSRFQLPFINHRVLGDIIFLGDHFNPSLVILAPLFWLTSNIKILLFEQALATTLSGLIIFLIARKLKFSYLPSLIFSTVFLIFAGVENPLVTDWHPEPTAGFFLLLFFYLFNFTKIRWAYLLSALIFIGFKESNALTFIFLLIWLYFLNKNKEINPKEQVARVKGILRARKTDKVAIRLIETVKTIIFQAAKFIRVTEMSTRGNETRGRIWNTKRKEIIYLILLSITWFFLTTKFLIPFFSHQSYMYTPDIPRSPLQMITNYFNNPLKTKLIFDSFISFGFLPIFSIVGLIPIFLELGVRVIPNNSIFENFALTFHYNVYLGIFLALATMYGVKNIISFLSSRLSEAHGGISFKTKYLLPVILVYLLIISLYTARKITNSPINFAVSPIFWKELKPRNDVFNDLKLVPNSGSVMSQNNLLPFFIQRKDKLMFLKENYEDYKPEIIVIDLTPGQNPNDFWDANYETALKIKEKLLKDKFYKQTKTINTNLFIFLKKNKT